MAIEFHSGRSDPGLIWAWFDPVLPERTRFEVNDRLAAEVPRHSGFALIRTARSSSLNAIGRRGRLATVRWIDGPELRPAVINGPEVRVDWAAGKWAKVRVRPLRWSPTQVAAGRWQALPAETIPASAGGWRVPDAYLQGTHLEVLLTPLAADCSQGRTEQVVVPPRAGRVEVRFRHVFIDHNGGRLRRLRVEVYISAPAPRPKRVRVRWHPMGRVAQEMDVPSPGRPSADVLLLADISVRGDEVSVEVSPGGPGVEYVYSALLAESDAGAMTAVLGQGIDLFRSPPYRFQHALPPNLPPLSALASAPMPTSVPGLRDAALERGARSREIDDLPSVALAEFVRLRSIVHSPQAVGQVLGCDDPFTAFLSNPQDYADLVQNRSRREAAARWGLPAPGVTTADRLAHAWQAERGPRADDKPLAGVRLRKFLDAASDDELDQWEKLLAAGASPELLREFRAERAWNCSVMELLAAAMSLDAFLRQPTAALVPELIPGCDVYRQVVAAASHEEQARRNGTLQDFTHAAAARAAALEAVAVRLEAFGAIPQVASAAVELRRGLTKGPAEGLAALRAASEPPEPAGGSAILLIEQVWADRRVRLRHEAELARRLVSDWLAELLTAHRLPAWPWHGTGRSGDPEPVALGAWRSNESLVRALPPG